MVFDRECNKCCMHKRTGFLKVQHNSSEKHYCNRRCLDSVGLWGGNWREAVMHLNGSRLLSAGCLSGMQYIRVDTCQNDSLVQTASMDIHYSTLYFEHSL